MPSGSMFDAGSETNYSPVSPHDTTVGKVMLKCTDNDANNMTYKIVLKA